ncbi:MAG: DUF3466 family protein [Acidobacteriia bacterium]|nr:DUF3466 family protein [Terriglobia bacterium]
MARCAIVAFVLVLLCIASLPAAAQVTYTTIDVPGAVVTVVQGINSAGDLVGYYANAEPGVTHGFLFRNGVFTSIDYPGADSTSASGINDSGLIVGSALKGTEEVGFTYDGTKFTAIRVHRQSATTIWGINNTSVVVGGDGTLSATRGYALRDHHLKVISPPGSFVVAYATGVNDFGEIVGFVSSGGDGRGFLYRHGGYKTIVVPGALQTELWASTTMGRLWGGIRSGPPSAVSPFKPDGSLP